MRELDGGLVFSKVYFAEEYWLSYSSQRFLITVHFLQW